MKEVPPVEVRNNTEIEISKILYRIVDYIYLIIIVALICGFIMAGYASKNSIIQYTATSQAFLANNVDAFEALGIADLQLGEFLKQDYIAAFSNRHVHEEVIKKLNLPYTPEMMALKISASYSEESHLINIHAVGDTAEEAVLLANTYVETATYFVSALIQNDTAAIWETAITAYPYETMPPASFFRYGVFGGGVLMLVLIVLFAVFDDRIRVPEEIETSFTLPYLGTITKQKEHRRPGGTPILIDDGKRRRPYLHIIDRNRPNPNGLDMINTIAANLNFSLHHKNIIAITSCANRDGKTYLSMQLGQTLAESGKRVVVVDCDLRKSTIKSKYGICGNTAARALESYLTGQCDMDECICETNVENLDLILCSSGNSNPIPLFSNPEFAELFSTLSEEYDYVLVDTPNAAKNMDAANIIHYCDGVLFVAAYARTKRHHIRDMLRKIEMTGCPVVGFVVNKVRFDCMLSRKSYWSLRNR
jgi:capsular exopolysaccharide synthesis family protein